MDAFDFSLAQDFKAISFHEMVDLFAINSAAGNFSRGAVRLYSIFPVAMAFFTSPIA